jgi:DNA-binding MurR/RpiR family transcriptional regulator
MTATEPAQLDADGVIDRLEKQFSSLSPRLRLAARYILDAPNDVAMHSMREVADRAAVHPSTLVRLAKQLDFASYAAFREVYRQRLLHRPATLTSRAHHLRRPGPGEPGERLFADLQDAAVRNVRHTFEATNRQDLMVAADKLVQARRVYVVGMRKCFPIAYFIHYCCRMFREDVRLITGFSGTLADELRGVRPDDAMVAISYDPYTRETVLAARDAADHGAYVIAITDSSVSAIAVVARQVFLVSNSGPTFFRSIASAMALAEALVAFVLAHGGGDSLENLRGTERQLDRYRAYWDEAAGARVRL